MAHKIISDKISPLNQDQLKFLSRHLADVNSRPSFEKRSIKNPIRSFCRKPWVMLLIYALKVFVLFSSIGVISLLSALYIVGYFS